MGRRSRKRHDAPGSPPPRAPSARTSRVAEQPRAPQARAGRRDEAPPPPWGAFPLVELCVLAAISLGIAGFVAGGRAGGVLLVGAVLIGSVAGLEVAVREHLGGYRSHTLVLSGTVAVAAMALLVLVDVDRGAMVPVAAAVFVAAFMALRALFKRRSGGRGVKVR